MNTSEAEHPGMQRFYDAAVLGIANAEARLRTFGIMSVSALSRSAMSPIDAPGFFVLGLQ